MLATLVARILIWTRCLGYQTRNAIGVKSYSGKARGAQRWSQSLRQEDCELPGWGGLRGSPPYAVSVLCR
eukprot:5589463-Amphidinium_carterae.1